TNGGTVSADTFGRGNAGTVNISATDKITIDGEDSDGFVSEASSSVNSAAEGDAGGVTIETGSLSLTNGGRVIASTVGEGNAGDVTVNARESITISGTTETESFRSGISADAFVSSGNGGDVNVFTNRLIINDGGSIQAGNFDNVDSLDKFNPGTGQPGNINIEANSLSLNRGRIEATTQSEVGEAANINLTIAEDIFFKNNSSISARASGNANGGNVTINAKDGSIVAFPNQNNDIIANAQQGNGGNIKITTQAIFGLEERRSTPVNQTNDIDASSQFGLQGDFSLNTPENEPSRGLVDLPENVVNPEDLISQNACKKGGTSKFTVTGRGGLPATPEQIHHSDEVEVGLVKPAMGMAAVIKDLPVAEDSTKLVPAKGWIRNEQGEVFLVGYDPTVSNILPQPENLDFCQPRGND
ncbi:MAG: S-layer family protein, partial [Waterburya sp.]